MAKKKRKFIVLDNKVYEALPYRRDRCGDCDLSASDCGDTDCDGVYFKKLGKIRKEV